MISRKTLAQFASTPTPQQESGLPVTGFDIESYLSLHSFNVIQRKPWSSHPGGFVFELDRCPFNPDHTDGSAAFTLAGGVPGFSCKHNGCHSKTIKDVFAVYPVDPSPQRDTELGSSEEQQPTQAQILCELAAGAKLFHTPDGEAYAQVLVDRHRETWAIRSPGFRHWLRLKFYELKGKPPASQALQDAVGTLEARAQFKSPEAPIFIRIAESGGAIYIDLCSAQWEAIEITAQGWRVVSDPPVRFKRSKGMHALPYPARGGSLALLRDVLNIGDDDNWILCLAWLIAACRPTGPYPILILHGEQGSAKSTTVRLLRRIIDPSTALVRTPPRDERDLLIAGSNSWVLAYDNVSGIPLWLSDAFCRVATGGGFSTRQLYTDADEVFFAATRPIILNGIDYVADRPDLAERALILNLPSIDKTHRREEKNIYADFENRLPQILGALCDAISTAQARLLLVKLANKPRMADFAVWAVAAAPALGFTSEEFLDAYCGNQADAVQETLEGDPIASAISALMDERARKDGTDVWEGNCKAFLALLEPLAADAVKRSRHWPKTPRGLSGRLRRLVTFLRESGIEISFGPRGSGGKRSLTITRKWPHSTATTATTGTQESKDAPDHADAGQPPSGGIAAGVADQPPPAEQPPPQPSFVNPMKASGNGVGEAVVSEVTVVCGRNLEGQASRTEAPNRVNICPRCGPIEWKWANGVWACPKCGNPAPGQPHPAERERYEL
jgi:hypothetical protein